MTYFADLSVCRYYPIDHEDKLIAVGWLDPHFEHALGDVDPDVVANLCELLVSPWEPCISPGWHDCQYCRFTTGPRQFEYNRTAITLGMSNVFVPGENCVYVAPSLILHYIDAHGYSPPEPFCQAVMECPTMRSMDYLKLLRQNAPRALVPKTSCKLP